MTTPNGFRDAEYIADISDIPDASDDRDAPSTHQDFHKKAQTAAKIAYINRLLRDLDIITYCELSALYYMDCSLILFATRAIVQLIFFTPKASPFTPTRNQPFIGAIFSSNLFCMLLHLLFVHPNAGEETRGYLHGGLFIDFIGQKAPVSRARLLVFDILVLVLNLVMLGLVLERVKTKDSFHISPSTAHETTLPQDHDAEERGVLRNASQAATAESTGNDIELQELDGERSGVSTDQSNRWRSELLVEPSDGLGQSLRDSHALDIFVSGEAVIMDVGIVNTIRDQWRHNPSTMSARSPDYRPSNETATFLRQNFGIEMRPDGRFAQVNR